MPMLASSGKGFRFFALLLLGLLVWITPAWAVTTTVNAGQTLNMFTPSSVTINPGDSIKWQWIAGIHTTTSGTVAEGPNGLWDAPLDAANTSFTRVFSISGIYPYYCSFHGVTGMTGTITVGTTSCSIAGATPVCPNTAGLSYTATIAPAGGTNTFSWTISGNGSIVGSSTSSTVSVTSLGAGSFTLTMTGARTGVAMMCTKVVTVSAATTCTISGNASVITGSTGNSYSSTVSPAGGTVTRSWTISGNGTITSGTTGTSVTVTAGAVGSFTLTLNAVRSGCPGSCQKIVTVNPVPPTCTVSGADTVNASSTGNSYSATVSPAGGTLTHSWSITGNGTITSAITGASITVNAGAPGSFTVQHDGTRDGVAVIACSKTVTVQGAAPAATVTAADTTFSPANVVINVGQSVQWLWGNGLHTTTNGVDSAPIHNPGSLWDAPLDAAHLSFTFQFNTPGYYPYFCRVHEGVMSGTVRVLATSGVGDETANRFHLLPSPNPFAGKVKLSFTLDRDTRVTFDIFDLGGRKVATLLAADLSAGPHEVTWGGLGGDHQPVVAGVYFARLATGDGRTKVLKLFKSR